MTAFDQALKMETALVNGDFKYDREDSQDTIRISLAFGGGEFSYQHLALHVVFDDDGTGAHLMSAPIVRVQADHYAQLLSVCNECNSKYRWAKFYIDGDDDLMVESDVPLRDTSQGDECLEVVLRLANIVDECYKDIMHAAWSD